MIPDFGIFLRFACMGWEPEAGATLIRHRLHILHVGNIRPLKGKAVNHGLSNELHSLGEKMKTSLTRPALGIIELVSFPRARVI